MSRAGGGGGRERSWGEGRQKGFSVATNSQGRPKWRDTRSARVNLRRVVAATIQVEPVLLGKVVPLLAQLASHQRVDAQRGQLGYGAVATSTAKGDAPGGGRSQLHRHDPRVVPPQGLAQRVPRTGVGGGPAHGLAAGGREKSAVGEEAELAREQRVVAQFRMPVERQVAGIDREVGADGGGKPGVVRPDHGLGRAPIKTMVHDQKIDAGGGGLGEGDAAGVHRRAEARHAAVVLDLEAVERVGVVFPGVATGGLVAKGDDLGERGHGEGGRRIQRARAEFKRSRTRGGAEEGVLRGCFWRGGRWAFPFFMSSSEYPLETVEQRVSYGVAYNMGANLARQGLPIDLGSFVVGLQDGLSSHQPRVPEAALRAAFETAQERMEAVAAERAGKQAEAGLAFLQENKTRAGVVETASGLQYEVLRAGAGAKPSADQTVEVHYHGTLVDGTVFDSSVQRGETVSFPVTGVIPGWVEALQLMQVGAKWRLFIPANLAYGDRGTGPIPPGSTLIFDVELVAIK